MSPRFHGMQTNFSGGHFSPKLEGRFDLPRYTNSVRILKNMTVMQQGGATRRWGFHFAGETKDSSKKSVLIPLIYSEEKAYMCEFGDQYIRFWTDGYQIMFSAGDERITNGDFTYDIGYWDDVDTGTGVSSYDAGRMRLNGGVSGVGAREQAISVRNGSTYTLTFDVFTNTATLRIGTTSAGQEILSDATQTVGSHVVTFTATAETVFIGFRNPNNNNSDIDNVSCREGTELITNPTMNTDIAGWTDRSTGTGTISASSGKMALAGGANGVGWAEESVATVVGQDYCVMFDVALSSLEVRIGTTAEGEEILTDTEVTPATENMITFTATSATTYIGFRKTADETTNLDNVFVRLWGPMEIDSPYLEADLSKIRFVPYVNSLFLVHPKYPPHELYCGGDLDWTLEPIEFIDGPYMDEDTDITLTPSATTGNITITSSAPLFNPLHVGALWRLKHGATWGYVEITGFTNSTTVAATVKATLGGIGPSVAHREGSWSDYRGYPSTVCFREDRIIYGATSHQPLTFWGSKSGEYDNFTPGSNDSDAFYYTLGSNQMNDIQWIKNMKDLVIGTMGEEFSAKGGADNPITPTNIQIQSESNKGSSDVEPERIGNAILFVQSATRKLIEYSFNWESDAYVGQDLSVVADDYTEAGIAKIAYQQEPDSILWVLDTNGKLIGVSYERSHDIVAWHEHPTEGIVEDIACMPNPLYKRNELWAIINRGTEETPLRYIEYLDPELNTDSALTYVGTETVTSVSGLGHLEGKTVDIVGDGAVYPPQVVTNGSVTLQGSPGCLVVEVGLHYESELETMRPEFQIAGTSQGVPKRWSEVWVRLWESIGCTINGEMIPFRKPGDDMGEGVPVFTGDKKVHKLGWDRDGRINVKQTQPLPLTVLSLFGVIDLGD